MSPPIRGLLGLTILVVAAGCASMGGLRDDPLDAGKERTFEAPFPEIVDAARDAVEGAELQIEDAYQPKENVWVILSKKGTSAWSWGELVRVVVVGPEETDQAEETVVRVVTKTKGTLNVAAKGDYSETIFSSIALALQ